MQPNQMLAHYRVEEKIGAGGMGEVFRAHDTVLGRDVALKMLPETVAQNPERLARFQREAQVLASLNHPGIAAVYGLESQDGQHALVMELVEGPELAERIKGGPLSVEEGLPLALQLAQAIEAAHEKGIIHRDLKPANIKLTAEGQVKVLDFGLAKALVEESPDSSYDPEMSPTLTANMTMGHVILGTAAYMSPEQARGTEVDRRADIWAYGVVVTEMLGGQRLFSGETVSDTLASVLKNEIDLAELPNDLSPAVIQLLRRCLQRDPKQRLRDIGDARLVLQDVLAGVDETVVSETSVRSNPWPLRAAIAVALVALAVLAVGLFQPVTETPLPLRKFEIQLSLADPSSNVQFSPAISPDGRYLLFVSQEQIWVRDLATTLSRALPGTEGARNPFWSPDGEWIGFGTSTAMMKIDRSGGHAMTLANVSGGQAMSSGASGLWTDDGTILFTTGSTGVLRVAAQAGEVTTFHAPGEGEVDFHQIGALPGGRGWVMVVHLNEHFGSLHLLTPEGQWKEILSYPRDSLSNPVWSPSGHILFERTDVAPGIWAVPFSLNKLEVTGEAFLVAAEAKAPSVSRDGTLVYSTGIHHDRLQLAWFDRSGELLDIIAEVQTSRPFPQISPDEKQILLVATGEGRSGIWLFDSAGGNERRLTFDDQDWGSAIWHPDGRHIVAYVEPSYEAFLITLDGSEPPRSLGDGLLNAISADGETFFYSKPQLDRGFDFDIFARPIGSPPEDGVGLVSTPNLEWGPVPSPDGKYLLYASDESGQLEIYATTYPGVTGRWQISRNGADWACWRGDGGEIYFSSMTHIYAVPVDDSNGFTLGRPRELFQFDPVGWSPTWSDGFDVTDDGERFVKLRPAPDESEIPPVLVVVQNWFAEFSENP